MLESWASWDTQTRAGVEVHGHTVWCHLRIHGFWPWEGKGSSRPSGLPQACEPITKCFLPWRFSNISGCWVFIVSSPKLSPYQTPSSDSQKMIQVFPSQFSLDDRCHNRHSNQVNLPQNSHVQLSCVHPLPRCPHARLTPSRAALSACAVAYWFCSPGPRTADGHATYTAGWQINNHVRSPGSQIKSYNSFKFLGSGCWAKIAWAYHPSPTLGLGRVTISYLQLVTIAEHLKMKHLRSLVSIIMVKK